MTEGKTEEAMKAAPLALCTGVLLAPVVVLLHLEASYAIVPWLCASRHGSDAPLHLITLAAVAVASAGGFVAWRIWRRAGASGSDTGGDPLSVDRFIGGLGFFTSLMSVMVILAQGIASFVLDPCLW